MWRNGVFLITVRLPVAKTSCSYLYPFNLEVITAMAIFCVHAISNSYSYKAF